MEKVHIFVSYSRQDDSRWFDEGSLIPYLARSVRNEAEIWVDREGIDAGEDFRKRIEAEIDRAHIAILLVSQGFLNSEFIQEVELPRIRERAERGELEVLPILTEPCGWDEVDFFFSRQMLPGKPTPLSDYVREESDWKHVRNEIRKALKRLIARIGERPKPPPTNEVLFRSLVEAAAADGEISSKETQFLLSKASQMGLTEDHANKIIDEFRATVETTEKRPQPQPHQEEAETPPVTPVMEAEPDPQKPASPTGAGFVPKTPVVGSVTQPVETKESIPARRSARVTAKHGVKAVEFNPAFTRPFEESIPELRSARVTAKNGAEYVVRELRRGSSSNRSVREDYLPLSQGGARLRVEFSDIEEATFLWGTEAKGQKFPVESAGHGYVFVTERSGKTIEGSVYPSWTFTGSDADGHAFYIPQRAVEGWILIQET